MSTKSLVMFLGGERTGEDMDGGEDTSRSLRTGEDNGDDLIAGLDILAESGGNSSCVQEMGLSSMFVIISILMGVGGGKEKVGFIMENKFLSAILKT